MSLRTRSQYRASISATVLINYKLLPVTTSVLHCILFAAITISITVERPSFYII